MGRIVKAKYRMEIIRTNHSGYMTPSVWRGRATDKRLAEAVRSMNQSFLPDGVNAHISRARGVVVQVLSARIVEQDTGIVVAEYNAPMFEVL